MGERMPVNKYIPANFDPSKLKRVRKTKKQIERLSEVRLMIPCSIRCLTCGAYMGAGTKFHGRKSDAGKYLSIKIFRFKFKCIQCKAAITYRTDPKNSDYVFETGAKRNYSFQKEKEEVEAADAKRKKELEETDAMAALEERTKESKRDMDIVGALEEIQSINARHQNLDLTGLATSQEDETAAKALDAADAARFHEARAARGIHRVSDKAVVPGAQLGDTFSLAPLRPRPALPSSSELPVFHRKRKRKSR